MATDRPPSAQRPAAFSPAGPAPITMTSKVSPGMSGSVAVVGPVPEGGQEVVHHRRGHVTHVEAPDDGDGRAELLQVVGAAVAIGQVGLEAGAPARLHHPVEVLGDELYHLLAGERAPTKQHSSLVP